MQLGGIGSEHSTHSHQVTDCLNGHTKRQEGESGVSKAGVRTEQLQQLQQETQLSFSEWVQNTLNKGKAAWRGVWGTGVPAGGSQTGQQPDGEQTAEQLAGAGAVRQTAAQQNTGLPDTEHTAAAEAAGAVAQSAHTAAQMQPDNPYFQPLEQDGDFMLTPAQRLRLRIKETTRQLADHLSGRFFGSQNKNFLQTKQEQTREDLRRRSRYKKDETEIDCILTDESYLMDSYDRRGEYSKLTTKK